MNADRDIGKRGTHPEHPIEHKRLPEDYLAADGED
jgi:hypothetical protein